ncbi:MAG: arginine--tRNA ligase [Bacillota bacterium]
MPHADDPLTERIKSDIIARLKTAVGAVADQLGLPAPDRPQVYLEVPKDRRHGDYASNAAMLLGRAARQNPRAVAQTLLKTLELSGTQVERAEIAGPGFINLHLKPTWIYDALREVVRLDEDYGRSRAGGGQKFQVEFVSANPTGPLVVVNARAAALGDTLAGVLAWAGYETQREYYVDNMGTQVDTLGKSFELRLRELLGETIEFPEGCYPGSYVIDIAKEFLKERGEAGARRLLGIDDEKARRRELAAHAVERIVAGHKDQLDRYGVHFDEWFSQKSLAESGAVDRAVTTLRKHGHIFEQDGAVWFRSTTFGDDKDRVVVRSNGEPTYFALDIAYHLNKFERGFQKVIDLWGPDHASHVTRMMAMTQALGYPQGTLEILIVQWVRLLSQGQLVKMSKRAGDFVTMEELIDEVGKDAARFFFLMRAAESHLDFDLDLAKLKTADNPVFYVQYAHARVSSLLKQAAQEGFAPRDLPVEALSRLTDPSELELLRKLSYLPQEIAGAAAAREPHRLTRYAIDTATLFHKFYDSCRVLGAEPEVRDARLVLVDAARIVLRNVLGLLGVSAPERM